MEKKAMTVKQKAKQVARRLRSERPDYCYLNELFRQLRTELKVKVQQAPKKLPYVPSEEEMHKYYEAVWKAQNISHMVMIKTLLYTGIRVGELIKVKIDDVRLNQCQIRINAGKGGKDRIVSISKEFSSSACISYKK